MSKAAEEQLSTSALLAATGVGVLLAKARSQRKVAAVSKNLGDPHSDERLNRAPSSAGNVSTGAQGTGHEVPLHRGEAYRRAHPGGRYGRAGPRGPPDPPALPQADTRLQWKGDPRTMPPNWRRRYVKWTKSGVQAELQRGTFGSSRNFQGYSYQSPTKRARYDRPHRRVAARAATATFSPLRTMVKRRRYTRSVGKQYYMKPGWWMRRGRNTLSF